MDKEKELFFLEEELEKYQNVVYRIEDEGVDYAFKKYSSFEEIEDEEFHKLRKYLIQNIDLMDNYLKNKIDELEKKIEDNGI
jgi:(p)ppGpp synthase/HD superfamily hydrolase